MNRTRPRLAQYPLVLPDEAAMLDHTCREHNPTDPATCSIPLKQVGVGVLCNLLGVKRQVRARMVGQKKWCGPRGAIERIGINSLRIRTNGGRLSLSMLIPSLGRGVTTEPMTCTRGTAGSRPVARPMFKTEQSGKADRPVRAGTGWD